MSISQVKNVQRVMNLAFKKLRADVPEVVFAEIQKDALLAKIKMRSSVFLKVIRKLQETESLLFKSVIGALDEILSKELQSFVEEEYKTKVESALFFEGQYGMEEGNVYFVFFFQKNVFNTSNIQAKEEDKAKREVSKIITEITKRRMTENKVYIFPGDKHLYVFRELFTEFESELLLNDFVMESKINEMTSSIFNNILLTYCHSKDFTCKPLVDFNIRKNKVVAFLDLKLK